jgi:hypothetical protein
MDYSFLAGKFWKLDKLKRIMNPNAKVIGGKFAKLVLIKNILLETIHAGLQVLLPRETIINFLQVPLPKTVRIVRYNNEYTDHKIEKVTKEENQIVTFLKHPKAKLTLKYDPLSNKYRPLYERRNVSDKTVHVSWIAKKTREKNKKTEKKKAKETMEKKDELYTLNKKKEKLQIMFLQGFIIDFQELLLVLSKQELKTMFMHEPLNVLIAGNFKKEKQDYFEISQQFVEENDVLSSVTNENKSITIQLKDLVVEIGKVKLNNAKLYFKTIKIKKPRTSGIFDVMGIQSFWLENKRTLMEKYRTSINPMFKALKYAIQHGQSKPNTKPGEHTKQEKLKTVYNLSLEEIKTYEDKCKKTKDCVVPNPATIYQNAMTRKQQLDPENTFRVDPWFLMRFINQHIDIIRQVLKTQQSQITENESLHEKIEKEKEKISQNPMLLQKKDVQLHGIMKEFKDYLIETAKYDECAQNLWNGIERWSQLSQTEQLKKCYEDLVFKLQKNFEDTTGLMKSQIIQEFKETYKFYLPKPQEFDTRRFTTKLFNYYAQKQLFLLNNRFSMLDKDQLNMLMQQAIRVLAEQWMLKTDDSKEYWFYVERLESFNLKEIIETIYKNCDVKLRILNEELTEKGEKLKIDKSFDAIQKKNEQDYLERLNDENRKSRRLTLQKKIKDQEKYIQGIQSKIKDMGDIKESYRNSKLIKAESYMNAFLKSTQNNSACEQYVHLFLKMRRSRKM